MTLGEIKIECLKLMKSTYEEITAANIEDLYGDENLSDLLYAMPGSINRCFDRFQNADVAPKKTVLVSTLTTTNDAYYNFTIIDLTQITDYERIDRVTYMSALGEYTGTCKYILEEDTLMLPYEVDGVYTIIYYPEMPFLESTAVDTDVIDLPGRLLRLVPYFVKSELYEEDQPELAVHARNIFESMLQGLKAKPETKQTEIEELFTFEE